jgi:hypothetical protein
MTILILGMGTDVSVDNNASRIDGLKQKDPTEGTTVVPNAEPTTIPKKVKSPVKKKVASSTMGMTA